MNGSSRGRHSLVLLLIATSVAIGLLGALWVYRIGPVLLPTHVGPLRTFYSRCLSIRPGTSVADARDRMRSYLEVGRTWSPPSSYPPGFFGADVANVPESPQQHSSRIIFIPDHDHPADWCLLYPDDSARIVRVELSPD